MDRTLPPLPTPFQFWSGVLARSQPGSAEHTWAIVHLERMARGGAR